MYNESINQQRKQGQEENWKQHLPFQWVNVTSHFAAEITARTSCFQEAITGKQQCRRWICFSTLPHVTSQEGAGHGAHNFKSKYFQRKTFLDVNIIYWPHRIYSYTNHLEAFYHQSKELQLNSDLSVVKGNYWLITQGKMSSVLSVIIRLCHTNFTCPMDVGDKQYGQKL